MESQGIAIVYRDLIHQISEDLTIEGWKVLRQCFQRLQQRLCLRDSIVMLRTEDAILFLLDGTELLGQFVASGYKNIRIYEAASVHVSQHSILIVDIRYSLVQLNDFQAPEHPSFTERLEVGKHLLEDRLPVEPELVVEPQECGVDFHLWNSL